LFLLVFSIVLSVDFLSGFHVLHFSTVTLQCNIILVDIQPLSVHLKRNFCIFEKIAIESFANWNEIISVIVNYSGSYNWCKLAIPCPWMWFCCSGWILGSMVWSLPNDSPYNWWACKAIFWEAQMLQTQHWWEPFNCNSVWNSKHSHCYDLQEWWEERYSYWCCAQVNVDHKHRKVRLRRPLLELKLFFPISSFCSSPRVSSFDNLFTQIKKFTLLYSYWMQPFFLFFRFSSYQYA